MRVLLLVLLLVGAAVCSCPDAGPAHMDDLNMIVAFSLDGFNKLTQGSIPVLVSQIQAMKFDDINTELDLLITTVDLEITSMVMSEMDISEFSVSTNEADGTIGIFLGDSDLQLSFNWGYQETGFPYISDHGTGTATVTGLTASISSLTRVDQTCGNLVFAFESYSIDFGKITIALDGGASALYSLVLNTFISLMEDLFADTLSDMLAEALLEAINSGGMTADWYHVLAGDVGLDQRYIDPGFHVLDGYIGLYYTSYGYPLAEGEDWPERTHPAPLPDIVNNDDFQMILSNNAFNTIFSAANHNGILSGDIAYSTVTNPMFKSYLMTTAVASVCPGLYDAYPDSALALHLTPTIDPVLTFMPSAGYLNITGTVDVSVDYGSLSDNVHAFQIGLSYGMAMTPDVWQNEFNWGNETTVSWNASPYNSTAWAISSEYGDLHLDTPQSQQLLMMLSALGVAPFVSQFTHDDAPFFGIQGDFFEYDLAKAFFDGPTTLVATIPLKDY
ncbi:hypothetical protein KIPB_001898 [Kipferlia bialata]|uniref:Lipid-binding serum glycoprotein C-terminal domain-containing protein n=1 Tax=Kipferlia bialata TaxID=797122 RepID=A0A9K3CQZ7_9EUKA|nr:hypothetical protein KIPB_001898 [Kipferlia bialata]|eukprot:g1898.t1